MAKFKENELSQNLKEFQDETTIELEFEKNIIGVVKMENTTVKYDEKYGYINIKNKDGEMKINTTLVYSYEKVENEIQIELEMLLLKIRKVNG